MIAFREDFLLILHNVPNLSAHCTAKILKMGILEVLGHENQSCLYTGIETSR